MKRVNAKTLGFVGLARGGASEGDGRNSQKQYGTRRGWPLASQWPQVLVASSFWPVPKLGILKFHCSRGEKSHGVGCSPIMN